MPSGWLTEAEFRALEATAKTEQWPECPPALILSYDRIKRAGSSLAEFKKRGWSPLQDGRAGMFKFEGIHDATSTAETGATRD